ncbi:MAG: CHAT domain-containing protein, partial [Anaerolineae bacterium]
MPDTIPDTVALHVLWQGEGRPCRVQLELPDGSTHAGTLDLDALLARLAELEPVWMSGQPAEYGQTLFNHLFSGAVGFQYAAALGAAGQRGIRLTLQLDEQAPVLHTVPWERLYHPHGAGWVPLAAAPNVLFSRYLSTGARWGLPLPAGPLRALIVVSSPYPPDHALYVDPDRERTAIAAVLDQFRGRIEYEFLEEPATLEAIAGKLDQGDGFDILHYTGHGVWEADEQTAYLILEKPANGSVSPQGVSAAEIAERLRTGRHLPQLIFLAACRSAQQSTTDAFRGLGPRLVVAGCPAVVAMQERVEVGVARQFGRQFYSQLLEHGTVDLAVNRARRAVMDDWAWQWAVPVLFMRLPNGLLFRPADRFPPEERRPYKGLAPYTPLDRDLFQGRSSESEDVYRRIREHAVVVVYGEAGVGLTSLMEAGVRPRLELDGDLVVTVSEYAELAGEVRSRIGVPLRVPGDAPLPDVLRAATAEPFGHLVLVLDQFERAFDLPAEVQDSIVAELAGSREALGDTLRLVFVVREDRLARLSALQARLEGLMQATVSIPPLLTDEAERAIVEPLRVLNWPVTIIPQTLAARRIVPDLAELSDGTGMVDPGDLQIVCDWLYRKALEPEAAHAITEDLYDREKSADGIMARYMEQTLETRLADRRPLAEHVLATMASPGVGRWVQPEQLPANGASSEQLIGVLERLAETQMLVERAMNGQRRYALANQTVAEQARRLGGREVERQYQAEAELERVWSAWLARDVPATRGQLRYLAEAGGHLTPPPVRTLLLLRSAVARDTPAAPWLDRLRSDAGRALIRELEEPDAPIPKNLRSSRSTLNKAGLLLGLHDAGRGEAGRSDGATADRHTLRPFGSSLRTRPASPLRSDQPGDERPPFGPVAWSAVSHSDAVTRQTAALALLAMDRHRGLDRLDWALRAVEPGGLRRRRRAELHGALADADPEIEKLNTDLPALDRAGIWWWRARRRIIRDRHRLAGLTIGGGIGAGLGLALLR